MRLRTDLLLPGDDVRDAILTGLVGNRVDLYHVNAEFKAAVHTLAEMLPLMVDGLAANHEREQGRRAEIGRLMAERGMGYVQAVHEVDRRAMEP
jgi:hypothetical protein